MEWLAGVSLVNKYRLTKRLGQGGFGEVWLATDRQNGREVAVKRLQLNEADHLVRFERECRILHHLGDAPGVVNIFETYLQQSTPFFVMEYCAGGSLATFAKQANPWRKVAELLGAVARTMALIHARQGFHRDMKPDNLLLPSPGAPWATVKIADFGLARVPTTSSSSMTGHPCGTRGYMAPELLTGATFTTSADVFSLGMTAVVLLTGGFAPSELDQPQIPAELRQLVYEMIDISPTRRPSMATTATRVATFFAPPRPAPPPPTPAPPPTKSTGFVDALFGVLGVAAAVGGAALAIDAALGTNRREGEYDPEVDRYRGADGRFRRGPR